jgi:hypothetical protein
MASKEIVIKPGEALSDAVEAALRQLLGQDVVEKARSRGGKFKITLTCPWPKPPVVIIDQKFVAQLKALAGDESQLEAEISKLKGPQILKVASLLEVPMSKSSRLQSLRAQLQKTIRSETVWNSIAGRGQSQPKSTTDAS